MDPDRESQLSSADHEDGNINSDRKGRKSRAKGKLPSLRLDQKSDLAFSELEGIQQEVEVEKRNAEKLQDTIKGVIEEIDLRISELKKDAYEFKRDIVVGAENARTGVIMAEKIMRFLEEKLRAKDGMVEKLRLKYGTLKVQAHKIETQLRQKEDMGGVLHYIDFHQLQIENKQYQTKIEEKNDELLKLKLTTGNTIQILNNLKRQLNEMGELHASLEREISSRQELITKLQHENKRVKDEIGHETRALKRYQAILSEPTEMPQTLDYVNQKAKMFELQQAIKDWERKVEIAELSAKRR